MKKNVGSVDRIIRVVIGVALLVFAFSGHGLNENMYIHYGAIIAGVISLATAALNFCGLYTLLGINTCKLK